MVLGENRISTADRMTEALIRVTATDRPANRERNWPAQKTVTYQCGDCQMGFFVKPASVISTPEGDALLRVLVIDEDVQVLGDGTRGIAFVCDGVVATALWDVVEAVKRP